MYWSFKNINSESFIHFYVLFQLIVLQNNKLGMAANVSAIGAVAGSLRPLRLWRVS
jgi:hypothetical protein